MFAERVFRQFSSRLRKTAHRTVASKAQRATSFCEPLETRVLLSADSATAQLVLTATTGSMASPVYHYTITVQNTGTNHIGTFWFGWLPGQDFLPTPPLSESNPTGWSSVVTGSGDNVDGSAIDWGTTTNFIAPGSSLATFGFTSHDSPAALAGQSPDYPSTPAMFSTIYSGAAFSDTGFSFAVTPAATTAASTTTLTADHSSINHGDTVNFTVTVAPASGTGATPTGTVTFLDNGTSIGSAPVQNDGTAVLSTSTLPSGSLSITAQYGGDSAYSGSTSAPFAETVATGTALTTTTLATSAASIHTGDSVTFTATVAAVTPGGPTPTGVVTFSQNGSPLGSMTVQPDGTAAISTTELALGTDSVTATYGGDSTYAASTSTATTETVAAPPSLAPTIIKSTIPAALVGGAALHGAVSLSITNATAAAIKGKVTLEIFASTNGVIDGSSIQLASVLRGVNVKTTKPSKATVPVKIAAGALPAGSYTLFARLVDLAGVNNDSAAGPALIVAAPFIALSETFVKMTIPASAVAGGKAHASAVLRITNNGNIITPATTTAALFATLSGIVDVSATQINSVTKPLHIHPGKSATISIPVKEIPAIAPGMYTIVAQVTDPNGQITTVISGVVNITAA